LPTIVRSRWIAEVHVMNSTRCLLFTALLSSLLLAAGCKKDEAAAAPGAKGEAPGPSAASPTEAPAPAEAPAAAPAEAPAAAPAEAAGATGDVVALGSGGKAKVAPGGARTVADTPTYKVTLASPAKLSKGAQATVMVEILPKEGWKLNKEFPTKLTVTEPAGVKVAKKEQTVADAVAFADKSGKWSVEFQADSAGAKAFTGQVKFAVCTETSCDPKKEQLAWNVAVAD
jgi:hypothetical protein